MALPTAQECRDHLEGYNITASKLSDAWIEDERDNTVAPFVQSTSKFNLGTEAEITEYYSGTAEPVLILNRRNINEITQIEIVSGTDVDTRINLNNIELIPNQGMLRVRLAELSHKFVHTVFPKGDRNIKVTYKHGGAIPDDLSMAIKKLVCVLMLDNLEGRTGGGALTVQAFGRNYGNMGKYTNIRKRLAGQAMATIRRYNSGVVGK